MSGARPKSNTSHAAKHHNLKLNGKRFGSFASIMKPASHNFDWPLFWFLQVLFLGAPTLITVMAFRGGPSLSLHRAAILGFILLGLTIFNVIVGRIRAARSHRSRYR